MAFITAAEMKLRKVVAAAASVRAGGSMLRSTCWPLLLLAAMAALLVPGRSIDLTQLLAHRVSLEMLPQIRDSIFATQLSLFLLLNSMIFAVLAPSGLFSKCSPDDDLLPSSPPCSSRSSTPASPRSPRPPRLSSPLPSSRFSPSPSPSSELESFADNLEQTPSILEQTPSIPAAPKPDPGPSPPAAEAPPSPSPDTDSSIQGREMAKRSPRQNNVSPPKSRVKRVKKMQKSVSPGKTVVVAKDIVEQSPEQQQESPTDSLKDEDFKHFVDSFIAHWHQQILLQEREYEAATAAGSRT